MQDPAASSVSIRARRSPTGHHTHSARSHVRRPWTALLPFALALAVTGCGGSEAPQPATENAKAAAATTGGSADACAMLSQDQVSGAVGNAVQPGEPFAGPEVCRWDTADPAQVSVLLTVRLPGSIREQALCRGLRDSGGKAPGFEEIADVSTWKFSSMSLFNSGDFEGCGPKGFVSLSLSGKRDEGQLKQSTLTILRAVLQGR